ncbi:MAG: TonB-dependent receptor [Verrucomicrobia bacterium]|nr:TonB-dependent receptor [Verrucomicrobiota bacterium]
MTPSSILTFVRRFVFSALVFSLLIVLSPHASAIDAGGAKKQFDLPADAAEVSLKRLGEQSGREVLFPPDAVAGVQTRAVSGTMTPEEALDLMLSGTVLVGVRDEKTGSLTVRRERTVERAEKNGESRLPRNVQRTTQPAVNGDGTTVQLERFTVTGSNIRMSASEADKALMPVELIASEKMQFTSGERLSDFLRGQPIIAGNTLGVSNTVNSSGGYTSLSVHGVGRAYTLSLINGRRFSHEDTVPDISGPPMEAIESVEVLKSGASAAYGSNAVGGVINIKTLDHYNGAEVKISYGNTTNTDFATRRASLKFGQEAGKLNVVGVVTFSESNSIEAQDRNVTRSGDYRPLGGIDRRASATGDPNRLVVGAQTLILDKSRFSPGQSPALPSDFIAYNANTDTLSNVPITEIPAEKRWQEYWNVNYKLFDERMVAYAWGFLDRHTQPDQRTLATILSGVTAPAANPYNVFRANTTVFYRFGRNELHPGADGNVHQGYTTNTQQFVFGLRGQIGRFTYDGAVNKMLLRRSLQQWDDVARELAATAITRTDATALNPFGYYANGSAQVSGLAPVHGNDDSNSLQVSDLKITGPVFELPAGDIQFAAGVERRKTYTKITYDTVWTTYTFVRGNKRVNVDANARTATAYYGELQIPLLSKPHSPLLNSAEINVAYRKEDYSDFQGASIRNAGIKLTGLDDTLTFRALYAEGFKAPPNSNLVGGVTSAQLNGLFDPVQNKTVTVVNITGANPDLKPETAKTTDVGVIYSPKFAKGLTLRADLWRVILRDRVYSPSAQDILNGQVPGKTIVRDANTNLVTINGTFANGNNRVLGGVDFGGTYTKSLGAGQRMVVDASGTYTSTAYDEFQVGNVKYQLVNRVAGSGNLGGGGAGVEPIPRFRGVLSGFYYHGPFSAGSFLHFTKGLYDIVPGTTIVRQTENYWTGDIQVSYDFGVHRTGGYRAAVLGGVKLTVGVDNFWDEGLPFVAGTTTGWDQNLADYRGRYYYVSLRKTF